MVLGALAYSVLLHSIWDFKAVQVNVQPSLIQELMLYEFKLSHNTVEAIENICYVKSEGVVDHGTVTRWVKKFCLGCKNLDNQPRPGKPKSVYSEGILQTIEANLVSNIQRPSGKLSMSQFSVVSHLHDLGKSIRS